MGKYLIDKFARETAGRVIAAVLGARERITTPIRRMKWVHPDLCLFIETVELELEGAEDPLELEVGGRPSSSIPMNVDLAYGSSRHGDLDAYLEREDADVPLVRFLLKHSLPLEGTLGWGDYTQIPSAILRHELLSAARETARRLVEEGVAVSASCETSMGAHDSDVREPSSFASSLWKSGTALRGKPVALKELAHICFEDARRREWFIALVSSGKEPGPSLKKAPAFVLPKAATAAKATPKAAALSAVPSGTAAGWTSLGQPGFKVLLMTAAVTLEDGGVLLVGGHDTYDREGTASVGIWRPSTGEWRRTADLPRNPGAYAPSAVRLADGRVLMAAPQLLLTWDPRTERWEPAVRGGDESGRCPAVPDGLFLLSDGRVFLYEEAKPGWTWDPRIGALSAASGDSRSAYRRYPLAVALTDDRVMALGGMASKDSLDGAELWSPSSGRWSETARMASPRCHLTAHALAGGRVLAVGGIAKEDGPRLATTEIWDPATGLWTPGPSLSVPRAWHTGVSLPDGRVLVFGGAAERNPQRLETEIFDPGKGAWESAGRMATDHDSSGAVATLGDGRIFVADCFLVKERLAEVWTTP